MKRFYLVVVLGITLLLATSVLAETLTPNPKNVTLTEETQKFVTDIALKKGVETESIQEIKQVDFNNLPAEINLENIDENNLAMYEINTGEDKPVYIITASQSKFKEEIKNFARKMFLTFGFSGEVFDSTFLKSAAGVFGSTDKGYVMIRDGSITGLSTSLEVIETNKDESVEILIYKNGEITGFRNSFKLDSIGAKTDYDIISEKSINFEKGDIISMKVIFSPGARVKDINTLMEISIND